MIAWSWLACTDPTPTAPRVSAPAGAPSLYELSVPLTTSDGGHVGLDVHRGHPALVSMFYASCHSACPLLVQQVQGFEATLAPETRDALRVLLVSLDPARDDPRALSEAASRYHTDSARWVLAAPPDDRVRELAAALDIQYRPGSEGEIHHSSILVLVDADGREVARAEAGSGDLETLRAHLE